MDERAAPQPAATEKTLIKRRTLLQGSLAAGAGSVASGLVAAAGTAGSTPAVPARSARPKGDSADRLLSGRAWDDFCEQLRLAGNMVERFGDTADALDRAEWYRFVTRLMRNGLERFMENCEPERPRLRDVPWRQSINFQSPDQDHLLAEFVDGSHSYRISGNRGTIPYFVIAAWTAPQPVDLIERDWVARGVEGLQDFNPAMLRTTDFLQSDAIRFDEDGSFEVIASQHRPDRDVAWLRLTPDCVGILVRPVYHRREDTVAPVMRIERLDAPTPRPVHADEVAAGLAKSAQLVLGYAELVRSWWQDNLGKRPNRVRFSRSVYLSNGGVADRHHGFGTWQCGADEALVLEFTPIECDYWIFQLCNIWQENLDNYEDGKGYVQKYRARYETDGAVRLIVSEEDPGIGGNHLPCFGHRRGGWSLRYIKTDQKPSPLRLYRLPLSQLRDEGLEALATLEPVLTGEFVD